jgi:hypothetical protein
MTEAEWLACTDTGKMMRFLQDKVSERKSRLFAVACCRRINRFIGNNEVTKGLETAERYSEGQIKENTARRWCGKVSRLRKALPLINHAFTPEWLAYHAVEFALTPKSAGPSYLQAHNEVCHAVAVASNHPSSSPLFHSAWCAESNELTRLLRDVVGPSPFRPIMLESTRLTSTVKQLAQAIYEEKAFDRMPILADALIDAGCDSEEIISHCRQSGEHIRGCWVVDLLTERK